MVQEDELTRADVLDVLKRAGVEVVDADHAIVACQQVIAEMGAEKPGPSGDDGRRHAHNLVEPGPSSPEQGIAGREPSAKMERHHRRPGERSRSTKLRCAPEHRPTSTRESTSSRRPNPVDREREASVAESRSIAEQRSSGKLQAQARPLLRAALAGPASGRHLGIQRCGRAQRASACR